MNQSKLSYSKYACCRREVQENVYDRVGTQVAQAPFGTVNTTLRNSVIIRVCMGI